MATTIAGRPYSDYADNWLSLFELFVSVSGLKLRLNIPDTVIVKDGRLLGWFYTSREGAVSRCALHEISPAALFQKLVGSATLGDALNPYGYVALCHFESGISRPLRREELQHLVMDLVGPYEPARPRADPNADMPFCLQAYIIPDRDLRYLAAYGGYEQPSCTVFARHFSARYTHITDPPSPAAAYSVTASDGGDASLSPEELVVESQLVAMGLLDARRPVRPLLGEEHDMDDAYSQASAQPAMENATLPASKKAKAEVLRLIQALISFVERAHGLRMQGLVAEFVQADAHAEVFVLLAVHAVQWDGRASKGRLGTFTERWQDYTNGLGPAPAAQPPSRPGQSPGLCVANAECSSVYVGGEASRVGGLSPHGAAAHSPSGRPWSSSALGRAPVLRHTSSELGSPRIAMVRPGSAVAQVVQQFGAAFPGPRNGRTTLRSALASSRRGAGGNPTAVVDSYTLFTRRDGLSTDTVAGSLVLEVERLKEQLQRQADIAARAETALTQLACTSQHTQDQLLMQLREAKAGLDAASQGRNHLESEHARLYTERAAHIARINDLEGQLAHAKAALDQDRATLAGAVRNANAKEEGLQDMCARLQTDNEQLSHQVAALQRRLEEEGEVLEAARNQLYDYRQMVTMLQTQMRRGKNKPAGALTGVSSPGVASSVNSFTGILGNMPLNNTQQPTPGMRTSLLLDSNADNNSAGPHVNGDSSLATAAKVAQKRPGNSPLNPAMRARSLNKSETTPVQRSSDGDDGGSMASIDAATATTTQFTFTPQITHQRSSSLTFNAAADPSSIGNAFLTQIMISPRSVQGGSNRRTSSSLMQNSVTDMPAQSYATTLNLQHLQATTDALLQRPESDMVAEALAELRRARKYGSNEVGNPFSILANSQPNDKEANAAAVAEKLAKAKTTKVVTMEDKAKKVVNPYQPVYENMHLNDVFIFSGELTERMAETLGYVIKLLKKYEAELLEVYNYYASLGKVQYMDGKLMMVEQQFLKLARSSNIPASGLHGLDAAEDCFHTLAERVMNYYSDYNPKREFITFPEFPEAVCRLAAAKYDWRPPEQPEEADDDIEQPEALRSVPLANISELKHANLYGVGPTAKLTAAQQTTEAEMAAAATEAAAFQKTGEQLAPVEEEDEDRDDVQEDASVIAAVSELGPQTPDVVLYTIIKTFLLYDLLPNAKRSKTVGSKLARMMSTKRTAPTSVWM